MADGCYHCGEPVPSGSDFSVTIDGQPRAMCCPGCQAVAQTIIDSGLASYYSFRTGPAATAGYLVPVALQGLEHYDIPEIQQQFVHRNNRHDHEITLSVDGITCAACAWLIEKQLYQLPGIVRVGVNTATRRAHIRWDPQQLSLSRILAAIGHIGYQAAPFQPVEQERAYQAQVKDYLKRLGVAGLATMQVMMFTIALYTEAFGEMEAEYHHYFRWVSLLFATPVLLYAAQPFYLNALRALRSLHLGMDVPVSLALLGAFAASAYATVTGTGEVYFESVSMFTFFLLLGRFFEVRARRQASEIASNLLKMVPTLATRITAAGQETVPVQALEMGDHILVRPGETVPADGTIVDGESEQDEALLTGESLPVFKAAGAQVYAGAVNLISPITVAVTEVGSGSLLSTIVRLQEQAQQSKARVARLADRISRVFVGGLLLVALATWGYWHIHAPADAFWITLAVLVATCPCALSLATPTALTCGTSRLNQLGLLIRQPHVLETLANIDHVIFDKTGTLTEGKLTLAQCVVAANQTDDPLDEDSLKAIAAALESTSEHPIAKAFSAYRNDGYQATQVRNYPGLGISARIDGREFRLGSAAFCQTDQQVDDTGGVTIYLSRDGRLLARFTLRDKLRPAARVLIERLQDHDITTILLSGDSSAHVYQVAARLGIPRVIAGATPEQKLAYLKQHRAKGAATLMLGDGINDAPVLAGADVSIAMGSGSDLAKMSADAVLLGDDLTKVHHALDIAARTGNIIRQNLLWALGYNLMLVPLAASGLVAPYLAAIGMSLSSLLVVTNSLRLLKP